MNNLLNIVLAQKFWVKIMTLKLKSAFELS